MIKNRTFLLLAANLLLAMFIMLNLEDDQAGLNLNSQFSEMIAKMRRVEFSQPFIKQKITLRKDLMDWQIDYPISWPVEPISMANFISKISHLNPTYICSLNELVDKGEIVQDYGFDENSSSFRLLSNNSQINLIIGDLTRDETGRYLLIDDGENKLIWRGPRQIHELVNQPITQWAKLTFFDFPIYAIDEFQVNEISNESITATTALHKIDENWYFSVPFKISANNEEVSFLLNQLVSTRLTDFAEPYSEYNRTKILDLNISAMGRKHNLSFSHVFQPDSTKLLVNSNVFSHDFYVEKDFLENFKKLTNKLREKKLFSLEFSNVNRVKITDNNRSLSLRKDENNIWVGLENNGTDVLSFRSDTEIVRNFIHNLNSIEVTSFVHFNPSTTTLSQHGLNNAELRLEIEQQDNTRSTLLISKSNSETSFWNTYNSQQSYICLVNNQMDELLSINAIDYKDRKLLPSQFLADHIMLSLLDDNKVISIFTYESTGEAYERLLDFKAKSFVDLSYDDEGLWMDGDWLPWKYSLTFVTDETDGANALVFKLTDRIGGTKWFAGSSELGMVCNLPISVIDELAKGITPPKTSQ